MLGAVDAEVVVGEGLVEEVAVGGGSGAGWLVVVAGEAAAVDGDDAGVLESGDLGEEDAEGGGAVVGAGGLVRGEEGCELGGGEVGEFRAGGGEGDCGCASVVGVGQAGGEPLLPGGRRGRR